MAKAIWVHTYISMRLKVKKKRDHVSYISNAHARDKIFQTGTW